MAGRIPQSFIDDLLARVDIVEIIDRYVPLKKAGANHKACCPFHGEKTPSFNVSQTKQFYHCFGCGVSGSAISFLMEFDHMHFVDAVEYLADSVGLEVPKDAIVKTTPSQQNMFTALKNSAEFFQQELKKNQPAIDYLKNRNISGETALEYQIGYAPAGWHTLSKALTDSENMLLGTGMVIRNDSGKTHDRFRERVMFPIRDRRGRTIGFGGRVMDNSEPKYLNSPETPLFQKGRELYGLYELRKHKTSASERIIVVEGYMDVIALAQAGINNAVATLGTATSTDQVATLFRETDEIVFCFDGDTAGKKAAWRALNSALPSLKAGRDAKFLFLPDGEDPDSVVNAHGTEHFNQLVANSAVEASAFMFQVLEKQAQKGSDNSGTGHKARLAELMMPLISQLPAGVYRDLLSTQLGDRVGIQLSPPEVHQRQAQPRPTTTPQSGSMKPSPVRRALTRILAEPAVVLEIDPEEYDFSDKIPGSVLLMQVVSLIETQPQITTSGILEHFRDKPEWSSLNKLAMGTLDDSAESNIDSSLSIVRHAIQKLNEESRMIELKGEDSVLNTLPSQMSDQEKDALRRKLEELKKALKAPRLFVDQSLQIDQTVTLDRDASKYIVRVLRRTIGDKIVAFNGDGSDYPATITAAGKETEVHINKVLSNDSESPLNITLVQSLAKGSKLDMVIQKATELGVNQIIPVSSDRSVLQIDQARIEKRMSHWRGVAISACTQCQRSRIPSIAEPQSFHQWLNNKQHDNTFLLHPASEHSIGTITPDSSNCTIVVGPEGGFTQDEIELALSHNIESISCGPRILRTETAGFTAIAILQTRFGDLK